MSTAPEGASRAYPGDVPVDVRVHVVGVPTVTGPDGVVAGSRLGGRRAHAVLAALALEGGTQSGARLAELVWDGRPPATWPVALRGVIGGLRSVLRTVGLDDQAVVATVPGGYRLAPDVTVDVTEATDLLDRAQELIRAGRPAGGARPARGPGRLARRGRAARRRVVSGSRCTASGSTHSYAAPARSPSRPPSPRATVRRRWRPPSSGWPPLPSTSGRTGRSSRRWTPRATGRAPCAPTRPAAPLLAEELGVDPTRGDGRGLPPRARRRVGAVRGSRAPGDHQLRRPRREVAAVAAHLAGPGLVTVAGPAEVGKSRVVAEVVHGLRGQGRPVRWVPLESVTQDALVPATVALALGLLAGRRPGRAPWWSSWRRTTARPRPLRLRVLRSTALRDLAGQLVTLAPQLTLVATSRVPLGLQARR